MTNFEYMLENTKQYDINVNRENNKLYIQISLNDYEIEKILKPNVDLKQYLCDEFKKEKIVLTDKEVNLLFFLDEMLDDCEICGVYKDNEIFVKGNGKTSGICNACDCSNINKCIRENGKSMSPREIINYCGSMKFV